jgi:hypothetical protein
MLMEGTFSTVFMIKKKANSILFRIDDIVASQFPVFQQLHLTPGDLYEFTEINVTIVNH